MIFLNCCVLAYSIHEFLSAVVPFNIKRYTFHVLHTLKGKRIFTFKAFLKIEEEIDLFLRL